EAGDPQAPTLLFLHGAGLSGQQWAPQVEALSSRFYCLAPDLPQQGRSVDLGPFVLSDAVERVAALIQQRASGGRAHVIGSSLGGAVALGLARAHPDRVDRLIVSGASLGLGPALAWLTRVSAGMLGWMPMELLVKQTLDQFKVPAIYRERLHDDLVVGLRPDFNRRVADALETVPLPERADVLVLVGEQETWLARRQARGLVAAIAGATGGLARGVGHVWNLEAPERFTATIEAFVSGAALPAGIDNL
ncbi:MAG TPA: alpha/beta fold hydrolase, partial [Myxococcota bacterium]|nr:alpha/beta fold hydrolase [Myxococcota bacterium]